MLDSGPHDHENPAMYMHITTTVAAVYAAGIVAMPLDPSVAPISAPMTTMLSSICRPP